MREMKRYSIPLLFFFFFLLSHFWFVFSGTTLLLLGITSLLMGLFVWALSEILNIKKGSPEIVNLEEETFELQASNETLSANEQKETPSFSPYFQRKSTEDIIEDIQSKRAKTSFIDIVTTNRFPLPSEISQAVYYYPKSSQFHECLWQKKDLLIASEGDGLEIPELVSLRLWDGFVCPAEDGVVFLPLSTNGIIFGAVRIEFKEEFQSVAESSGESLLETWKPLSEALYDFYVFEKQKTNLKSLLYSQKTARNQAIESFAKKRTQTLVSLAFGKGQTHLALLLDDFLFEYSGLGVRLFENGNESFCLFIDSEDLNRFCKAIQFFADDADLNGLDCEIVMGFADSKAEGTKLENWFEKSTASLKESLSYLAA